MLSISLGGISCESKKIQLQTSDGTLLRNGSRLGKMTVAQPLPPFFKTDHNFGKTALRTFTCFQQSYIRGIIYQKKCQK